MTDEYSIQEGITESQIAELITLSTQDPVIKKFTSDPTRFRDRKAFDSWKKKAKMFVLKDKKDSLFGIIWLEKLRPENDVLENLENYDTTFAIRLYKEARGKGLAKQFMRETFGHVEDRYIWLSPADDNKKAINLYQQFGFQPVGVHEKRLYMIYENKK